MAFAIQIDGAVDIDMCDSQFLLSLKPASKEEEVEEKIQRIAEGKARDGVDISVNDALDYIASITKLGKTYYQARSSFVWQYLQVCNIHYINPLSFLVPSLTPLSSLFFLSFATPHINSYSSFKNQRHAGVLSSTDIVNPLLERLGVPNPGTKLSIIFIFPISPCFYLFITDFQTDFVLVACTILHDLMPTYDVALSVRVASKVFNILLSNNTWFHFVTFLILFCRSWQFLGYSRMLWPLVSGKVFKHLYDCFTT